MTRDIETLTTLIHICMWIASICATAFPVLYSFSPWYRSRLGRAMMMQAIAFAVILDVTLLFQYWAPSGILVIFWINVFAFAFVAATTAALTVMLLHINHYTKYERTHDDPRASE